MVAAHQHSCEMRPRWAGAHQFGRARSKGSDPDKSGVAALLLVTGLAG